MKSKFKLLVCDLDNTLYDWVYYFVNSFYSMIDEIIKITDLDRERVLDDFRSVHQRHHDTEHPFSVLEVPIIREKFSGLDDDELMTLIDPALHRFNSERKKHLELYPNVLETLEYLKSNGISIVAHSEAKYFSVIDRISRFSLTENFDAIYCRERSESQFSIPRAGRSKEEPKPALTNKIIELEHHERKPSPGVLRDICASQGIDPAETVYVGDSLSKDILMAVEAGVFAVWAKYGSQHSSEYYARLVRVSHWTQEDIDFEAALKNRIHNAKPDAILENDFGELLNLFSHV